MVQFNKAYDIPKLDLKYLERNVGILFHLVMAYPLISNFLRGLYLTINHWIESRHNNVWNMSKLVYDYLLKYLRRSGQDYAQEVLSGNNKSPFDYITYMNHLYDNL